MRMHYVLPADIAGGESAIIWADTGERVTSAKTADGAWQCEGGGNAPFVPVLALRVADLDPPMAGDFVDVAAALAP